MCESAIPVNFLAQRRVSDVSRYFKLILKLSLHRATSSDAEKSSRRYFFTHMFWNPTFSPLETRYELITSRSLCLHFGGYARRSKHFWEALRPGQTNLLREIHWRSAVPRLTQANRPTRQEGAVARPNEKKNPKNAWAHVWLVAAKRTQMDFITVEMAQFHWVSLPLNVHKNRTPPSGLCNS